MIKSIPETEKSAVCEINNQVTAFLFERARPEILIGLVSALIVAGLFWDRIDQTKLLYWTGSAMVLYILRLLIIRTRKVNGTRAFLFLLLLMLCGILWGAAGYSVISLESNIHKAGLLVWITCLCFLITLIYAGKLSYFLAFTIPALGLTAYALLDQTTPWNPTLLYLLIATGAFLFLVSLIYHNFFLSELRQKAEYQRLLSEHNSLMKESKKMEVTLKTTIQKNEEILANLNQSSEKLDQYERRNKTLASTLKSNLKTDIITNLSNRNNFLETVTKEWQRSARSKEPLTVAFINVDGAEQLIEKNDKKTAFSTLKKIGESIKSHGRRAGDLPARFDKAGFALLLLGADSNNAVKIVDSIRESIKNLNLSINNDPVTVHAGVATLVPHRKINPKELFEHVESATFEAQFQGGDRVVSFHAFNDIEICLWDSIKDGELNETNFQQKLYSLGYNTKRELIPPKTTFRDQRFSKPTLFAVYSGIFLLNIEGQAYELKRGSSLVLPENLSFSAETIGDSSVVLYLEK